MSYLYRALYYDNKRSNRFTRVGGGLLYGTSGSRNNSYMKVTNRCPQYRKSNRPRDQELHALTSTRVRWDGTYGLMALSKTTRKFSNRLQMSLQRQHFSPQLFKDPEPGIWTIHLPHCGPLLHQQIRSTKPRRGRGSSAFVKTLWNWLKRAKRSTLGWVSFGLSVKRD